MDTTVLEPIFESARESITSAVRTPVERILSEKWGLRAVYVIWKGNECLYVGKGRSLYDRLQQHFRPRGGLASHIARGIGRQLSKKECRSLLRSATASVFRVGEDSDILHLERFVQLVLTPRYGMGEDDRRRFVSEGKSNRVRAAFAVVRDALRECHGVWLTKEKGK